MNLPENGKIVIVDNDSNEALPLISILSKLGLAASYFSGGVKELPLVPIPSIRILFIDLVLTAEQKDASIIMSAVKSVLDRILADDNGPFVPIAWTKRQELISDLEDYLKSRGFHFPVVQLVKKECKAVGTGEFDLNVIVDKIKESLVGREAFQFCVCWENLAHRAAGKTIDEFSRLKPFDDANWNSNMKSIIWKLANAFVGKLDKSNTDEILTNSLYSINGAFSDNLYTSIRNEDSSKTIGLSFQDVDETADPETSAVINSKFNITDINGDENLPGNVYEAADNVSKVNLFELFQPIKKENEGRIIDIDYDSVKSELKNDAKHILLETSPVCDYAQRKWQMHRLLPGLLWPVKFADHVKRAKFSYKSPLIKTPEGKFCHLVFDFRYFTSLPFDQLCATFLFRIKPELLTDIQSNLASHVNRPGVVFIE